MPAWYSSYFGSSKKAAVTVDDFLLSLKNLAQITDRLREDVIQWKGDTLGAIPLLNRCRNVANDISACTDVARQMPDCNTKEADEVQETAEKLSASIERTMEAIVAARPKIRSIPFIGDPVAMGILQRQRSAAAELIEVVTAKAGKDRPEAAAKLASQLDGHFAKSIAEFNSRPDKQLLEKQGDVGGEEVTVTA